MNQLCKVCGEPAAGFHFGAFTCEGCKSFFGRTYNNLSQIHECKNGGACVINKQNRTSCKACRLRKCLFVGMSKSGSRYGRRSNWFKIHCLLQEKAAFVGQPPNFRSPVTPTLQDGSLPFVASQMREPVIGLDAPGALVSEVSTCSVTHPASTFSQSPAINASSFGFSDLSRLAPNYSSPSLNHAERKYQEEMLNRPPRPTNIPFTLGTSYREHVFNLLQRSQSYEPISQHQDHEPTDELRVTDVESRLRPKSLLEWERRMSRKRESDCHNERKSPISPAKEISLDSPVPTKNDNARLFLERKCIGDSNQEHMVLLTKGAKDMSKNCLDNDTLIPTTKEEHHIQDKCLLSETKVQDSIMTDEERLSFLKSANNMASCVRNSRTDDPNHRLNSTLRFPNREDLLYNPVNSNLFSFPPYPHIWPSMIPFGPFSKFYSPFCPPRVPPSVSFDPLKPPTFPLFNTIDQRVHFPLMPKEDPESRKRLLDDILQIQRHNKSPNDRSPLSSPSVATPRASLVSLPQESRIPSTEEPTSILNQPIDLTVRRKRKMDKSEIIYKPGDDVEEMESEIDKYQKEGKADENHIEQINHIEPGVDLKLDHPDQMELKVTEIEHTLTNHSFVGVPLKVIKLETNNETLAA